MAFSAGLPNIRLIGCTVLSNGQRQPRRWAAGKSGRGNITPLGDLSPQEEAEKHQRRREPFPQANGRIRTDDLRITSALLYRLSYVGTWCRDPESNWGHMDFQSTALPTELSRRLGGTGLEPVTSCV